MEAAITPPETFPHPDDAREYPRYGHPDAEVEQAIRSLLDLMGESDTDDVVREILVTGLKLIDDEATRGDVKLMNSALKELRHASRVFAPYRDRRKITIFGSARTPEDRPEYRMAVDFGRRAAKAGFMVITGAGDGIMKAGHEGAGREASFGVNIRLPFEQSANSVIEGDPKLINFKYFFTRKLIFLKETDAVVLFPGGAGTQDEGFETLTLLQTGKSHPMPLVMVDVPGGGYWEAWERYVTKNLIGRGVMSPEDRYLWFRTEDAGEAVEAIRRFHRVFHGIRYVRDVLVMRLHTALSPERIHRLNDEFSDLVAEGRIEATGPLPEESNEPELAVLPRLAFRFNHSSYGRLRLLIDAINGGDE